MSEKLDDAARVEQIIEWDIRTWSCALPFWRSHSAVRDCSAARALEIGSRHGGLSLWLALQGFDVMCSDIDPPTPRARALHQSHGVAHKIAYAQLSATDLGDRRDFDVVCFKSVLGAVGRGGFEAQRAAVDEMFRVLRPGGEVWFAENLRASPAHRVMRRLFVPWARSWRYLSLSEVKELFGTFSSLEVSTVGCFAAFGRTEAQRRLLARLDQTILASMLPQRWRYVAIGVARK